MKNIYLYRLLLVINLLLITAVNNAQNNSTALIEEALEELSINNEEEIEIDWTQELEELSERMLQPINLNAATKQELEQFPFLSDAQIENILAYIYMHGQLQTVYELQLIEGMDRQTIDYLLPFVCSKPVDKRANSFQWKDVFKEGKQELLTRLDLPFYTRKGYEKTYLGPPLYHSLRYQFRYKEHLYAGIVAEKDSGEPLGALHNKQGYDYYSFYLLIRDMNRLKTLALGNYRLSFGQGLVISTDYSLGKTAYSSAFTFRNGGIRKHSSTDEYNYFRGMAAAVALNKQFTLSAFYSHRSLDGVIEENKITSIYRTGLHRSQQEAEKKNQLTMQLAGGNLTYRMNKLKLGVTGIYYFMNRAYEPLLKTYAKYNMHGNHFFNGSVDYAIRWHQFSLQGEAAIGKSGFATLNRLQYVPASGYQLMLVHRYYAHDYWAMFARSFGEGSLVQNENGWYFSAEGSPLRHWKLFASIDLFSFPWWRYRISKPSQGVDVLLQATYSPFKNVDMYVNYRYKRKERDVTGSKGVITLPTYHHRYRYRLNYSPGKLFSLRTTLDYNHFQSLQQPASQGYQLSQMISCQLPWLPLKLSLQGSYFHTDDYDSRVYVSECGLMYSLSVPSYQGEGIRLAGHLRYDINSHWMFIGKMGQTLYYDRNEIGSGNDLIRGNKKLDMQMQLRLKF